MVGSADSLDFLPDLSMSNEYEATPIDCWQSVCLSKIWVPSHLLPTRKNPPDTRAAQGIFHTLQKRDHAKCIESFSVYSDSDGECEQEEIFLSDSDEETLDLDTIDSEKSECATHSSAVTINNISLRNKHSKKGQSLAANENEKYEDGHTKTVGRLKSELKSFSSLNNLSLIDVDESTHFTSSSCKLIDSNLKELKVNNNNQNEVLVKSVPVTNSLLTNHGVTQKNSKVSYETIEHVEIPTKEVTTSQIHTAYNKEKNQDSNISLHEILDSNVDIDMRDVFQSFTATKKDDISGMQEGYGESNKKRNKKEKKKKKTMKAIALHEFLEDYDEEDRQDDYCKDYLKKILAEQNKDGTLQMRNQADFPDLTAEEFHFIHSQEAEIKSEPRAKTFSDILAQFRGFNVDQSVDAPGETAATFESEISLGKIAIENIPPEADHEEVHLFLSGFGEIKNFSIEPHGNFLKAVVEIDLMNDIDWIIECLNGTEPFGASTSAVLKCYKL